MTSRTAFGALSATPDKHARWRERAFEFVRIHFSAARDAMSNHDCAEVHKSLMTAQFFLGQVQAQAMAAPYSAELEAEQEQLAVEFDEVDVQFITHCVAQGRGLKHAKSTGLNGLKRRRK